MLSRRAIENITRTSRMTLAAIVVRIENGYPTGLHTQQAAAAAHAHFFQHIVRIQTSFTIKYTYSNRSV